MADLPRTVTIVIRETGAEGGKGFELSMGGDTERIGKIPDMELSPAEFWGSRLFGICAAAVVRAGAAQTVKPREPT